MASDLWSLGECDFANLQERVAACVEERIVRCEAIDAPAHYTAVSSLLFILDDQHSMVPITATRSICSSGTFFNYM